MESHAHVGERRESSDIIKEMSSLINKIEALQKQEDQLADTLEEYLTKYTLIYKNIDNDKGSGDEENDEIEDDEEKENNPEKNLNELFESLCDELTHTGGSDAVFYNLIEGDMSDIIEIFSKYFDESFIAPKLSVKSKKYHWDELASGCISVDNVPAIEFDFNIDDGGGTFDTSKFKNIFLKLALASGIKKI